MNHLRTDGGKAEAGNFFCVLGGGDCGEWLSSRVRLAWVQS